LEFVLGSPISMSWMMGKNGRVLARANTVLRDASKLELATKSPATEAKAAAKQLVGESVLPRLDTTSIEEIKPLARGEGIRWAALESNGFRSVGALLRAGWAAIDAKPGLGEQTVRALREW